MTEPSLSYEEILSALAGQVGLDPQELLSTQELVVDGQPIGLQLEGDERSGDLIFFAGLGTPAPEQLQRVVRTLLEANHFWVGTGGCTLGLQPGTGAVTLCGRIRLRGTVFAAHNGNTQSPGGDGAGGATHNMTAMR